MWSAAGISLHHREVTGGEAVGDLVQARDELVIGFLTDLELGVGVGRLQLAQPGRHRPRRGIKPVARRLQRLGHLGVRLRDPDRPSLDSGIRVCRGQRVDRFDQSGGVRVEHRVEERALRRARHDRRPHTVALPHSPARGLREHAPEGRHGVPDQLEPGRIVGRDRHARLALADQRDPVGDPEHATSTRSSAAIRSFSSAIVAVPSSPSGGSSTSPSRRVLSSMIRPFGRSRRRAVLVVVGVADLVGVDEGEVERARRRGRRASRSRGPTRISTRSASPASAQMLVGSLGVVLVRARSR